MDFSYARGLARQLVLATAAVALVEIPVAHVLLTRWNGTVATVVTVASVLFVAYMLADWGAALRRPIRLEADRLVVARGLRRPCIVPLMGIAEVRTVPSSDGLPAGAGRTVYAGEANVLVALDRATAAALGRAGVAVAADDPTALVTALRGAIDAPPAGVQSPS
ncbi:hypothetical protein [Demequina mangrovi]|uniref:PH domain-containing protein n=1 Tax=Demequina mangrovi TaxID=1043493 RepID=A0A1H7AGL2_9MICO|nr:hypothetical protein [Demequina mangrovi]SEJ63037.1 hypothetical protein SAMN05421637_2479 [Demequina mangrovi]